MAYTFFSNENSKGVPLTDYDLLKAHHLRFVFNEKQAEHLASKWNTMTSLKYRQLDSTLSVHLFRLRKWMRKRDYDAAEKHRTKEEFSAAQIIPEIPPFGEQFEYYEKIQGGTHFFGRRGNSPWIASAPLTKYLSTTEHEERQVTDSMHLCPQPLYL